MATSPGAFRFLTRLMQLMNTETPHQPRNVSLEAFSCNRKKREKKSGSSLLMGCSEGIMTIDLGLLVVRKRS